MRPEEVLELLSFNKFVPFTVHLSDGTTFEIHHPDQGLVTRSAVHILIMRDERGAPAIRVARCALIHINRLETIEHR